MGRNSFGLKPTLTIVGDNDHNFAPIYIDGGFDCRSQFTVRGRKEMMSRPDDRELGTPTSERLSLNDPFTTHF